LAWNVVRIYAMATDKKRLPDLTRLYADRGTRKHGQSRGEMMAAMMALGGMSGINLRVKES
jgi:hypothetical protein